MGKRIKKIILLFPPNWSACVNGPHLALPLIAGSVNDLSDVETWDLSEEYYNTYGKRPNNMDIVMACKKKEYELLNKIYFDWEDSYIPHYNKKNYCFGLLSGYRNISSKASNIKNIIKDISNGTVYSEYFNNHVRNKLILKKPDIVGITVSSINQLFSAIELINGINEWLPKTRIIIGGNIITRLKDTDSMKYLSSIVDKVVVYQGEKFFRKYLIEKFDYKINNKIVGDEKIDFKNWPVPYFKGLNLENYPGGRVFIPYVSSRGCYHHKCTFCAIPFGWSKSGYAGTAPSSFIVKQIKQIIKETKIVNIKFVDESFFSSRIYDLYKLLKKENLKFFWEAYVRVEKYWENIKNLKTAFNTGCRKLYFGLEVAPESNQSNLNKRTDGNIKRILELCEEVGIRVHLFSMVGHPGTNNKDALYLLNFLIKNEHLIDTADLVGFRLERGKIIRGIIPVKEKFSDFSTHFDFITKNEYLNSNQILKLEKQCQDIIWNEVPRLVHPLYRIGSYS